MQPKSFAYWGDAGMTDRVIDRLLSPPSLVAVDIETISLKDRSIIGVGFAIGPDEAFYLPLVPTTSPHAVEAIVKVVDNPAVKKVYHNIMFDLPALRDWGADTTNIADTMLMARLCGLPQGLKDVASGLLNMEIQEVRDVLPRGGRMLDLPYEVLAKKCINDVLATYRLYTELLPHVDSTYYAREMALIPVLVRMSEKGLRLDQGLRGRMEARLQQEVDMYRALAEGEGFNPGSNKQVALTLMDRGSFLPIGRNSRGLVAKVDEDVLLTLSDPLAALVLNYRKVSKLLSTYILPWQGAERAYTHFHLNTDTGRLGSRNRNLQNLPAREETGKEMRNMFLPDSGVWTDLDYSQQELRTLAHLSQDSNMLWVYEKGLDIHQDTADFMRIERKTAKNVTFAMIYGGSPETIMETAGIRDVRRAVQLREAWFNRYREAGRWIEEMARVGLEDRKVKTLQGRWLYLPLTGQEGDAGVMRKAVNYVIQGSAAEITKDALLRCADLDLRLQVHDELLIDGRVEVEELIARGLEEVAPFHTPLGVKYLERWE